MNKGKDSGKEVTHKIEFTDDLINLSKEKVDELEWKMIEEAGGMESSQRNYKVNPYQFARHKFSLYIDPEMIISRSMGTDQLKKERAFTLLTDPRVAPYVDQQAVIDKFILEDYSDGDPDEFKKKQSPNDMLNAIMGQETMSGEQVVQPPQQLPINQ